MKFVLHQPIVDELVLAQVEVVDRAILQMSEIDICPSLEAYNELDRLYNNVSTFGVSDQLRDLIEYKVDQWSLELVSNESALSTIGNALKKAGSAVWQGILTILGKLKDFIMKFFKKERTAQVVKALPGARSKLIGVLEGDVQSAPAPKEEGTKEDSKSEEPVQPKATAADKEQLSALKKEAEEAVNDKASGGAGAPVKPTEDVVPRAEYEKALAAAAATATDLERKLKEQTARVSREQERANAAQADKDATDAKLRSTTGKLSQTKGALNKEREAHGATKKAFTEAVEAAATINRNQAGEIEALKKARSYMKNSVAEQARLFSMQVKFYRACLVATMKISSNIEQLIKRASGISSVAQVKELFNGTLTMGLPASAIGPAASELSQLISVVENIAFEDGDAFFKWRDTALKDFKYLAMDGVTPTLKTDEKSANNTFARLGYVKDLLSGELGKKYEGVAAVANKINTLITRLEADGKRLQSIASIMDAAK